MIAVLAIGAQHAAPPGDKGWSFVARPEGITVLDSAGVAMPQPFLGGFDLPRPQLVDLHGDGKLVLMVQERPDDIMYFEQVDHHWIMREEKYQNLSVGEWFRFVDIDGDGRIDLLGEMPTGYIRMWRNVGTKTTPRFVAVGDTIRDTDGLPILADRQNILNAVDIDCNGKLDLFVGRVQGTVDRFEQDALGPDGTPRFRLIATNWEGIEILGPEARIGRPGGITGDTGRTSRDAGGESPEQDYAVRQASVRDARPAASSVATRAEGARRIYRHGANTLTFADITGRGVLDLFWGDFFEPGLLRIENSGTCQQPNLENRPVQFPAGHPVLTSGYNAPTFGDLTGSGNLDLVMGVIGGAYGPSQTSINNLYWLTQAPKGNWQTVTSRLIPTIDVGSDAVPVLADLHASGKLDLLIGSRLSPGNDATGTITWFENVGTKTEPVFRDRGILPIHGEFSYAPTVVDLDGDGLPDIVVGTWRDRIEWYRNTGTLAEPRWTLADSALVIIPRGSNTAPAFADIDGDGKLDLIIGTASGRLLLYRNVGSRTVPKFELVNASFQEIRPGRRSIPVLADLDGDGKPDLLIGTESGAIQLWRNTGTGPGVIQFALDSTFHLTSYPNAAPAVGDLHGRGRPDIFAGTGSGGIRWFENRSTRP